MRESAPSIHETPTAVPPARSPADERRSPGGRPRARGRRRSVDLKALLVLLPLLVAVPLLVFGGFLLSVTARQAADHARREQAAAQAALQSALVGALQQTQQLLEVFATSVALGERGLQVERAAPLAESLVRAGIGVRALAIVDRSGAVLVETPRPAPPRSVALTPEQLRVFETGAPAVSDLHESPLDGGQSVSIDVPVRRGGRVAWVVTAALDPAHVTRVLSAQVGARDALATVLDSHRRILARTRDLVRWYGERPSSDTLRAADSGRSGWGRFPTRDGNLYLWTWSTLPSGWTVWFGNPAREFGEALHRSILRLALAGIGVLVLAMLGAALLAHRIAASVDRMARNAHRLTEGERPPSRASGIRQLDALYHALEDASAQVTRALADRDGALEAERAARAVADEHNRSKDAFLGMLSHELRNPLAPIRASVYLLEHADPASDRARRARAVIGRQSEHLTRLVDDLLDVTRIARGKILLHREPIDLREIVQRAAEDARIGIEQRGVRLRVELPASELWTDADPTRVTQILGNLLHNAAKFTHAGEDITVALRAVGATAELRVSDAGAGIDQELLPRLFDAFVQGKRTLARTEGGLGLGLALVRGLAELHGGSVRAWSDGPGMGAEFVVTLPALSRGAEERMRRAPSAPAVGRRRVLVVDDNADAAESLSELISLFGHQVDVAHDGPSAVEQVRRARPDVVLCDIGLPGMSGYDVARAIRAMHEGAMRLIAVSGYAQPDDVARALESGFDEHVAKPPDPAQIASLLEKEVGGGAGAGPLG